MTNHVNHQAHDRLTKNAKLRLLRDKIVKTLKGVNLTTAGKPVLDTLYKLQTELRAITKANSSEAAKLLSGAIGVLSRRLGNEALQHFMRPAPAIKKPVVSKRVNSVSKAFEGRYTPAQKKVADNLVTTTITLEDLEQQIKAVEGVTVVFRHVGNFVIPGSKGYPYKQRIQPKAKVTVEERVRRTLKGTKFADLAFVVVR